MRAIFLLAAAFCTAATGTLAAPAQSSSSYVVHEKRGPISTSKWTNLGRVDGGSDLMVRIGLKQRNLENAHEYLFDISHPNSPNFGKHWTSEKVIEKFAPSDETVSNVKNWLVSAGIDEARITHSDNKAWLAFAAPARKVEGVFQTEYYRYQDNTSSGKNTVIACEQYHVPDTIQKEIDYVVPGVIMKSVSAKRKRKTAARTPRSKPKRNEQQQQQQHHKWSLGTCDKVITPDCIAALYHIPRATKAHPSNSMGIFEEGDYYAQEDLDLFFSNLTPWIPNGTHPIPAFIDGAQAPVPVDEAGGESDLDFQLAYPLVYPQTITLYQTDDEDYASGDAGGLFNTFLDAIDGSYCTYCADRECGNDPTLDPVYPDQRPDGYNGTLMCGVYKPTNVISVSYGMAEYDFPQSYQERQCNEFLKLGLQGVSIFFASGDDGVAGVAGDDNENGCLGPEAKIFSPDFPNTCPWITNVGATIIYPNHTVWDAQPESAVIDGTFSSGGGFSNVYPIPEYQASAVKEYFFHHNPPYPYYRSTGNNSFGANGGLYNRLGRGYPDVAALGDNILVINQGEVSSSGGTSASTPIFAAIINLINEERLAIGKGPVGFVNPVLYENPQVLNDITNGSNPGCGTDGFFAVKGWDPVTGLGTPNYPKMLELFLSLP